MGAAPTSGEHDITLAVGRIGRTLTDFNQLANSEGPGQSETHRRVGPTGTQRLGRKVERQAGRACLELPVQNCEFSTGQTTQVPLIAADMERSTHRLSPSPNRSTAQ